ncbi:hypothetical protein FOQG_13807 [Fusarium oxysporum f. sp. raphani 54005]|uniref:Zn(2)-C6 fungal-type domain-containing protein n=1 Tax=Fusarium oxysporum f. sp. raphani 54005 TaxID=1089458 RepID=X0BTK9_FUSOX|nr:hypothetical protein FOQG_13807 [Fusarium oxysporum f. sp. raphani 54005]
MGRTGQRISGCKNCRLKHLKCDDESPCAQCVTRNLHCDRSFQCRFRHSRLGSTTRGRGLDFPPNQRWCKLVKQEIEFVDQTLDIVRSFNSLSDPEAYPSSSEDQPFCLLEGQDTEHTSPCIGSQHAVDDAQQRPTSSTYSHTDSQPQESSNLGHATLPFHQHSDRLPGLVFHEYTNVATEQIDSNLNNTEFTAQDTYASYGDKYQLRLPTCVLKQDEAELVRHFFSGFSDAFDLGDPDRPFSSWISTRVLQYPRLLESVLTIASRHLGKGKTSTTCLDSAAESSSDYTQRLPSISSNIDSSMEETHSVADLLSRFAQSMEAKCSVSSPSLGQATMMDGPTEPFEQGDLPEAASWANLRLEAYLAVVNQAPFPSYLDSLCADKRGAPVDDKDWANLMLLHLTDIIRYCFSDDKDTEHYAALLKDTTIWSETKPDSFDPIYTCDHPEKQVLPDIWLYSEPVAAGLQYYHLSRMLLMSHDPRLPKIGLARNRTMKQIEVEMKNDTKIVCAIAAGMGEASPTYLTACMAIALVGDLFDKRAEQDTLLCVLANATDRFGWPTSYIKDSLKKTWGWL